MLAVLMQQITKRFGAVTANDQVDLRVEEGEIHALIGENGAGKSTLMHILYGFHTPDSGVIAINGRTLDIRKPSDAISLGIGMVHQHFMLIPPLTVAENVILGREPGKRFGLLNIRHVREAVENLPADLGVDPDARIDSLSVAAQQKVEILKLLYRNAGILILDEPTPVLTPQEIDELFATLRELKRRGKTIILISHKLSEVMEISDSVTVMRGGKVVASVPTHSTTQAELAQLMVGMDIPARTQSSPRSSEGPGLVLYVVSALNDRGVTALRDLSLTVSRGEILGIAAVEGNGQSELVQVIAGLRRPSSGQITINGEEASRQKIAHIPEDRTRRGIAGDMTIYENLILGRQREETFSARFRLRTGAIRDHARSIIRRFDIRPPEISQRARNLSGGNQQKVVVGRELSKDAPVIVASQPTRGLDIGAMHFVHGALREERDKGKAILLVSSDLDELLSLSDRIAVMYGGEIVFVTDARSTTPRELGGYMVQGKPS